MQVFAKLSLVINTHRHFPICVTSKGKYVLLRIGYFISSDKLQWLWKTLSNDDMFLQKTPPFWESSQYFSNISPTYGEVLTMRNNFPKTFEKHFCIQIISAVKYN